MIEVDVEEAYLLLHPRPVVLVVSLREGDSPNVMACSWITPVSEEPPYIALAMWRENYSYQLIMRNKEFTVNIPGCEHVNQVWIAGTRSGRKVDKAKILGFKFIKSSKLKTPYIDGCLAYLGCRLDKTVDIGEISLMIAEIVEAKARKDLLVRGKWNLKKAKVLQHLGGKVFTYSEKTLWPSK